MDRFRKIYGDAARFEVARIDDERVNGLVRVGDLDGAPPQSIAVMSGRRALYLEYSTTDQAV